MNNFSSFNIQFQKKCDEILLLIFFYGKFLFKKYFAKNILVQFKRPIDKKASPKFSIIVTNHIFKDIGTQSLCKLCCSISMFLKKLLRI